MVASSIQGGDSQQFRPFEKAFFKKKKLFILLGLHCCVGFSLVVGSRDSSLVAVCRLLIVVASLVVEHRLRVSGCQ